MLDAGNRELWEQGFKLKSAKHEVGGRHSGEVIFSVVEFAYGVRSRMHKIASRKLWAFVTVLDKTTEYHSVYNRDCEHERPERGDLVSLMESP